MKRLPRKRKKQVKKIVQRKTASKMAMTAAVTAQAYAQTAIISSTQFSSYGPIGVVDKALSVTRLMVDTAQAIGKIMSEPPNSWREFIR